MHPAPELTFPYGIKCLPTFFSGSIMNKSLLAQAENTTGLVTPRHIGRRVVVGGLGAGILRYVGSVHGKDGVFCGVELFDATGKHDGTFQGVSYFVCEPLHGIFAPLFRVELSDSTTSSADLQAINQNQNRLSRSALPALQLRNPLTATVPLRPSSEAPSKAPSEERVCRPPETDPMQMSIFSDLMDGSTFSNGSWSDVQDSMITSNCTFTNSFLNDDDSDLMSVPMMQSVLNIDREALRREEQLQSSMVLGESRIGVEHLPIIEDDELETPLVEVRPMPSVVFDQKSAATELPSEPVIDKPRSSFHEEDVRHEVSDSISGRSSDTGYHDESDPNIIAVEEAKSLDESKKPSTVNKTKKEAPMATDPETPKTARKPLVKEPVAVVPKFPVKQKVPSKHQLMMEQLKASIEAEKNKPKKEVKSRVSLLPPPQPAAKSQKENEDISMGSDVTNKRTASAPAKQPLKAVNAAQKPSVERPKKERKPLYVAPPPKERTEKKEVAPQTTKPTFVGTSKMAPSKSDTGTENATKGTSKKDFPTSSFAGIGSKLAQRKPSTSSTATTSGSATAVKSRSKSATIDEAKKLTRLRWACSTVDVLALVVAQREKQRDEAFQNLEMTSQKLDDTLNTLVELRKKLSETEKMHNELVLEAQLKQEHLTKNHDGAIERLKQLNEQQLDEKAKEFERTLDDERRRREAEMAAMSSRHQKVVASLDEKIGETEKLAEQLKADKKALQTALANDSDQRNQMLSKEISSLQTALEMKSAEMKELRQKNQQLSLQVDEIPLKELEISKWRHKSNEYKHRLDQKTNCEKALVQQIEDLRRRQAHDEAVRVALNNKLDLMNYHFENGDVSASDANRFSLPSRVQFRSRSSASGPRPTSSTPLDGRMFSSSNSDVDRVDRDVMNRSTLSMYANQVRLPENHGDDIIYAPDEIISSRSGSISQRLSVAIEDDGEPKILNETNSQSDSGIGIIM
ncbi:unnamed protein product [Caenorhabditis auriculariae]|uniref:CAP-Gly domain-containing protein n=1 Tax=Caenorhabditis auriculariae TaxID=2777116 RepID=A0A8S1GYC2_9PELO|nr:unnamed protein product [Caenorhabditis auriculariae]